MGPPTSTQKHLDSELMHMESRGMFPLPSNYQIPPTLQGVERLQLHPGIMQHNGSTQ